MNRDRSPQRCFRSVMLHALTMMLLVYVASPGQAQQPDKRVETRKRLAEMNTKVGELYRTGSYADAERLAREGLALSEQTFGPKHAISAMLLGDVAMCRLALGDLATARRMDERVVDLLEAALGAESKETARALNNLAECVRDMGDAKGAKGLCERSLAIRERVLGPDHPSTAKSLDELAMCLCSLGDAASARTLLERSLAIRRKACADATWSCSRGARPDAASSPQARGSWAWRALSSWQGRGRFWCPSGRSLTRRRGR